MTTDAQDREAIAAQAAERRRASLKATAADMVRTLLVILAIVVVLVLLVPQPSSITQPPVNLPVAASAARPQLSFEPAQGVPDGWRVTSTRVRRETDDLQVWNVNYVTDAGTFVGLEQAAGYSDAWLDSISQGGRQTGTVTVDGRSWTVYLNADRNITTLVLRDNVTGVPQRTTVVLTKGGGEQAARRLAESLKASL